MILFVLENSDQNSTFNSQRVGDGNLCVEFEIEIEIEFGQKFCEFNYVKKREKKVESKTRM